jgi:DNA-binding transcriptional ArsR family regulator
VAEKTRERVPKRKIGVLKDKPESDTKTKQDVRYQSILSTMHRTGSVTVEALAEILDVTVVTIRRDLDALERKGLLNRTHGGAVPIQPLFYEPFRRDRSFMMQVERQADEKRRIGYAAAALLEPDETIAVTPGTTAAAVVRALPLNYNLTVVTNTAITVMENGSLWSVRTLCRASKTFSFIRCSSVPMVYIRSGVRRPSTRMKPSSPAPWETTRAGELRSSTIPS